MQNREVRNRNWREESELDFLAAVDERAATSEPYS